MKEVWKNIDGYEGKYQVSNLGNVKSLNYGRTGKEQILRPSLTKGGYLTVALYRDDIKKMYCVHRLVAVTFIPNPGSKPCIAYKNGIKTDNRADNLRWCTYKEINNNPIIKQRQIGNQNRAKKVICDGVVYNSIKQCAEHYNVKENTMSTWLTGRYKIPTDFQAKGLRYYKEGDNNE